MRRHAAAAAMAAAGFIALAGAARADNNFHPKGDVFDTPPPAAEATGRTPCLTSKKYVDLVNASRYQDMGGLFAEDAVFLTPTGKVLHGSKEIGAFYAHFLGKLTPKIVPISFIADGKECIMELAAVTSLEHGHYQLGAIDHMTVNEQGKIQHMVVYLRPQSFETQKQVSAAANSTAK